MAAKQTIRRTHKTRKIRFSNSKQKRCPRCGRFMK